MQLFSSWTGSDFLLFYAGLLACACAASWWVPARLRKAGRRGVPDDLDGIALLAGGPNRLTDSQLAELFVRGDLVAAEKGRLAATVGARAATHAGKALLALGGPFTLDQARKALAVHARRVAARLQRTGLMLRPEEQLRLRCLSIMPFAALLLFGLYRQRAGLALGEPAGALGILLVLTAVLAVIRFSRSDPRTAAGIAADRELRARHAGIARAPREEEAPTAVAIFGTGVLAGTPWEPVHAMRQGHDDGGSGGNTGGDSGDDGDGGDGCGG